MYLNNLKDNKFRGGEQMKERKGMYIGFTGIDGAGNEEEERKTVIKIDCTPPGISFIAPEEKYLYVGERKIMPLMRNTVVVEG